MVVEYSDNGRTLMLFGGKWNILLQYCSLINNEPIFKAVASLVFHNAKVFDESKYIISLWRKIYNFLQHIGLTFPPIKKGVTI